MRFSFFALLIILLTTACSTTKKSSFNYDSWIGGTKQDLILSWGPPERTESDGNGGEVLVFAHHTYYQQVYGPVDFWEYRLMYVNEQSKIYHWKYRKERTAPQQIDVRLFTN